MTYQDLMDILFARGELNQEIKVSVLVEHDFVSTAVETTDIIFVKDVLVVTLLESQVRQLGVE